MRLSGHTHRSHTTSTKTVFCAKAIGSTGKVLQADPGMAAGPSIRNSQDVPRTSIPRPTPATSGSPEGIPFRQIQKEKPVA